MKLYKSNYFLKEVVVYVFMGCHKSASAGHSASVGRINELGWKSGGKKNTFSSFFSLEFCIWEANLLRVEHYLTYLNTMVQITIREGLDK